MNFVEGFRVARLVVMCAAAATRLLATDVNWSSPFFQTNLDSEGNELSSEWTFFLGYFEADFVPTSENTEDWSRNWITVDATAYLDESDRFVRVFESGGDAVGENAFVWGLNRQDTNNEWILLSNRSWVFPGSGGFGFPVTWSTNDASVVVVGELNQNDTHMQTAQVAGEPPVLDYFQWLQFQFTDAEILAGDIVEGGDDPDGDGFTNLLEFALGTSPRNATSQPILESSFGADGRHVVTVARARQTSAILVPEVSGNLVDWDKGEPFISILHDLPVFLVFRDSSFGDARFARVRVGLGE